MGFSSNVVVPGRNARKLMNGEVVQLVCKTKRQASLLLTTSTSAASGLKLIDDSAEPSKKKKSKQSSKTKKSNNSERKKVSVPNDGDASDSFEPEVVEMFPIIPRSKFEARYLFIAACLYYKPYIVIAFHAEFHHNMLRLSLRF